MWGLVESLSELAVAATNILDSLAGDDDDVGVVVSPEYVITDELIEFLNELCQNHVHTFVCLPLNEEGMDAELSAVELQHATAVLKACPLLERVRYQLCPKQTTEKRFWRVYFHLLLNVVHGDQTFVPPSPPQSMNPATPGQRRRKRGESAHSINMIEEMFSAEAPPVARGPPVSDSESIASDWRIEEPVSPASSAFVLLGTDDAVPSASPPSSDGLP